MSIYGSGIYGSGVYGVTLDEVTAFNIINPGTGNQLNLSWTNPSYPGFIGTIVLRNTSSISDDPTNGISYTAGNTIGTSTVVFVGDTQTFSNIGLVDGTLYYYKIFSFNNVYTYSASGIQDSETPTDVTATTNVTDFIVSDIGTSGTLYLTWSNPSDGDLVGGVIRRSTVTWPVDETAGDYVTTVYASGASEYYDIGLDNNILYYYSIFTFDEVPNYSSGSFSQNQIYFLNKEFKFIDDNVTNLQAIVDKERISLYWDKIDRTKSLKAISVNSNDISLTALVSGGDVSAPYNTFTAMSSGLSSINDVYNNNYLIFTDSRNSISLKKKIEDYTPYTFTIEDMEYEIENSSRFGFSSIVDLIGDDNIHINSTITYTTTTGNFEHKITTYDSTTKTFTASGTLDSNFMPGDAFTIQYAYYPKLYISDNNGDTYDNNIDLIYYVSNSPTGESINNNIYYNKFKSESTILNIADPKFYVGAHITFLTGPNRGFSNKIVSFNTSTKEFTTDYFKYTISQNDVFTINTYSFPLISNIENYVFKMVLWNYNINNPIYGKEVVTYPSFSLYNYLVSLDNGYWDTNLNTNLYSIVQGLCKDGLSRSEIETILHGLDFSIDESREAKLYNNFGKNLEFEKNPETSYVRYRKSIKDLINGFRNTGTYEGLYSTVRAFSRITPTIDFISATGWRLGQLRLGYNQVIINKEVILTDNILPYNTVTSTLTSLSSGDGAYTGDYLYFTSAPSGSEFNQALYGSLLPITNYETSGSNAIFTIGASGISTPIPSGAAFSVVDLNRNNNYGTIPYSNLALLFGVRVLIYGPTLNVFDTEAVNNLLAKSIPLHINYITEYKNTFVGETSWGTFNGTKTNLKNNYETNTLIPITDQLLEHSLIQDQFTTTVTAVSSGNPTTTFSTTGSTIKNNYYKNKYIVFTSGNNNGISKRVTSYIDKTFITEEFPYTIQVGDSFKLETIKYQTKYITRAIDLQPSDMSVNFFDNVYTGAWFARKLDSSIEEKVYIEFSDNQVNFTSPREMLQNEELNEIITATVTSVDLATTTFSVSATNNITLSPTNDFYNNHYIKFISGLNDGESNIIVDYNGSTKTFTTSAFTNNIQVGDSIQLLVTDMKRYAKLTIYHNYLESDKDIEVESLVIKIL